MDFNTVPAINISEEQYDRQESSEGSIVRRFNTARKPNISSLELGLMDEQLRQTKSLRQKTISKVDRSAQVLAFSTSHKDLSEQCSSQRHYILKPKEDIGRHRKKRKLTSELDSLPCLEWSPSQSTQAGAAEDTHCFDMAEYLRLQLKLKVSSTWNGNEADKESMDIRGYHNEQEGPLVPSIPMTLEALLQKKKQEMTQFKGRNKINERIEFQHEHTTHRKQTYNRLAAHMDQQMNSLNAFLGIMNPHTKQVKGCGLDPVPQETLGGSKGCSGQPRPQGKQTALPVLHEPLKECSVIVSASILGRRRILQHLRKLLPTLNVIERDFDYLNAPNYFTKNVKQPGFTPEADILISPSIGLKLTTLQSLHQLPLPGRAVKYLGIRSQVAAIASRYATLIVLVSQNLPRDLPSSPLSNSDETAISSFENSVRSKARMEHEVDVQVIFVSGGEIELGHWVAFLITKHSLHQPYIEISELQTPWEINLCVAGFNAYAAQYVLKEIEESSSTGHHFQHAIEILISMDQGFRAEKFGGLFGCARLADRLFRQLELIRRDL